MKRFCEKISRFLLDVDNVTEDEIDEVRFGIELILTQMILFFLLLAIGIFRNMVLETIIFIIALVGLRTFVDGYHADSFYRCMFLTTLLYLGTLYFADFENSYLLIMAILIAAKAFMWQENHEARNVKISKLIFWGCLAGAVLAKARRLLNLRNTRMLSKQAHNTTMVIQHQEQHHPKKTHKVYKTMLIGKPILFCMIYLLTPVLVKKDKDLWDQTWRCSRHFHMKFR